MQQVVLIPFYLRDLRGKEKEEKKRRKEKEKEKVF